MDVATTPAIQAIGADSVLTLGFAFFRDGGEVTVDVAELWMSAKANDPNYIMAVRAEVPAPSMDDEDRNEWDRILNRRHPYNATPRDGDDRTRISGIVGAPAADDPREIGRASRRERECSYVYISVVDLSLKQKHNTTNKTT